MRRRGWLLVSVGAVLGVVGVASALLVPRHARRQAGRLFSNLAVCLAGPERVADDEAIVRARRLLHEKKNDPALARCADAADSLARSRWTRLAVKPLVGVAEDAASTLREGRIPDLTSLWSLGLELPWDPANGAGAPRPPEPLLDAQLPELRLALPASNALRSGRIDRQPFDRAELGGAASSLVLKPDAKKNPFRVVAWEQLPGRRSRWSVKVSDERVALTFAQREPSEKVVDLGPGESAELLGQHVLWLRGGELHARRLGDDASVGPDSALKLTSSAALTGARSCRTARGHVLTVATEDTLSIVGLDDSGLVQWTSLKRSDIGGDFTLACDDSSARLAWAVSEPGGPIEYEDFTSVPKKLPENNAHRIVAVDCARSGCRSRERRVRGIDAGWYSLGGWGSDWAMSAPTVLHLGRRLLLLWISGQWVNYRFDVLDALERAPTKLLAEAWRPERDTMSLEQFASERRIAWPELAWLVRGESALVAISENTRTGATFVVRFDADGDVSQIAPPPRR